MVADKLKRWFIEDPSPLIAALVGAGILLPVFIYATAGKEWSLLALVTFVVFTGLAFLYRRRLKNTWCRVILIALFVIHVAIFGALIHSGVRIAPTYYVLVGLLECLIATVLLKLVDAGNTAR